MAYVVLALLVAVTLAAAYVSRRRGDRVDGCCAPADPSRDLRMRGAPDEGP